MRAVPLAALLAVPPLLVAGCANTGRAVKVDPPTAGAGDAAPASGGPGAFSREGWFGGPDGLHARLDVKGVERQAARSVLRYSVTALGSSAKPAPLVIGLLDPVGRRLYRPTGAAPADGPAPGAAREMAAEYPPLPPTVQKLTVLTPGTAGEFTGIPVTSAPTAPAPPPGFPPSQPAGGAQPLTAPTQQPASGTPAPSPPPSSPPNTAGAADLYDIVESETKDTASSASTVTVNLRAPFEGASAKLTSRAKALLDETARQVKTKAANSLTIDGYADSKNQDLAKERAGTVMKELKSRLGDDLTYKWDSKVDPGAGQGRVEVTYRLKTATPPSGTPAAFRPDDGRTVATRTATFGTDKRRLEVKPFYRDGAYIVAVFTIVNEGPGKTPPDAAYTDPRYPGGAFTSFSIQAGKQTYRAVRVGPATPTGPGAYLDPGRATHRTGVNEPARAFLYLPAPQGDPRKVTFNAGPFGKVEDVPVA